MNWVRLYRAMYLKTLKEVSREQRPSLGTKTDGLSPAQAADRPRLLKAPLALPDDSGHTFNTGHAGGERRDH